jgi:hypothetical protein
VAHSLFKIPAYNYIYLTCFILLGLHLFHAFSSAFQNSRIESQDLTPAVKVLAWVYSIVSCRLCIYFTEPLAFQTVISIIMEKLVSKIPDGPLAEKWTKYKASVRLVNPANKKNWK